MGVQIFVQARLIELDLNWIWDLWGMGGHGPLLDGGEVLVI